MNSSDSFEFDISAVINMSTWKNLMSALENMVRGEAVNRIFSAHVKLRAQ